MVNRMLFFTLGLMFSSISLISCNALPSSVPIMLTPNATPSNQGFKLAQGVYVEDLSGIVEGYSVNTTNPEYTFITVNVSADRLQTTFLTLAKLVQTPGYSFVEVPTQQDVEESLATNPGSHIIQEFHKDVYYLDKITFGRFEAIFIENAQLFVNDGGLTFGFGSHKGYDEVYIDRYKIMRIYATNPKKYIEALQSLGYMQYEPLKTVWDNINPKAIGKTSSITIDGKDAYDLVSYLVKKEGFYFAERRESP